MPAQQENRIIETPPSRTRKSGRFGIFFVIMVFFGLIMFSQREAIITIECSPEIIASKPDIIMLGAWWCTYCHQAKTYFQHNKIHYCEYDMENTSIGKQLYQQHGGGAIPKLLIGDYQLHGFDERQIEHALKLLRSSTDSSS